MILERTIQQLADNPGKMPALPFTVPAFVLGRAPASRRRRGHDEAVDGSADETRKG